MILPFEQLLVLGAICIYLFDSALLLQPNQLIMVCSDDKWTFGLPSARWEILRKHPYLPNPVTPHRGLFPATWFQIADSCEIDTLISRQLLLGAMRPIQIASILLLLLLFLGLPITLLLMHTSTAFIGLLVLIYLDIIFMLAFAVKRRQKLMLSKSDLVKLAFDALACPPLAVNMVRRISVRQPFTGNPIALARRAGFDELARSMAIQITPRVTEMLEIENDEEIRDRLARFKHELQETQN